MTTPVAQAFDLGMLVPLLLSIVIYYGNALRGDTR